MLKVLRIIFVLVSIHCRPHTPQLLRKRFNFRVNLAQRVCVTPFDAIMSRSGEPVEFQNASSPIRDWGHRPVRLSTSRTLSAISAGDLDTEVRHEVV